MWNLRGHIYTCTVTMEEGTAKLLVREPFLLNRIQATINGYAGDALTYDERTVVGELGVEMGNIFVMAAPLATLTQITLELVTDDDGEPELDENGRRQLVESHGMRMLVPVMITPEQGPLEISLRLDVEVEDAQEIKSGDWPIAFAFAGLHQQGG